MDVSTTGPVPLPETPDLQGAYPRLSDEQLQALSAHGERRATRPGQVLYREGDEDYDFFVVLAGTVAVVEKQGGGAERVVAVHGPGRFLGELSLLTRPGRAADGCGPVSRARSWPCRWSACASWSPRTRPSATWCCGPISSAARS